MKRRNTKEEAKQPSDTESSPRNRDVSVTNSEYTISEALFNLSVEDRTAIEEEVHGVSCLAIKETPELLEDSLRKFHLELALIDRKPAFDRAQELLEENPLGRPRSYIHATGYKLRFLRCVLFDASKAAKRYCKWLDTLLELFGEFALKRPIRMTDLSREGWIFLKKGHNQVLPCRDRSGRRIFCVVPNARAELPKDELTKVYLYYWSCVLGGCEIINNDLDQIETQRKGVVVVYFPSHNHVLENMRDVKYSRMRTSINRLMGNIVPIRCVAVHLCLPNNPWANGLSSLIVKYLSSWLPRTKIHLGNHMELQYQLQGYGIPSEQIPSTGTGNIKTANIKLWIKWRTYFESQQIEGFPPISHIVECPGSNDVLFRRGKSMLHHPGNAKFLNLIELRIHEHTIDPEVTPMKRVRIETQLIQQIRQDGGRFLKWEIDRGWWVHMSSGTNGSPNQESDKELQSKVHYAFRDFRKKMLRLQQERIVNPSSTYAFAQQDGQKRKRYCSGADETCNDCI